MISHTCPACGNRDRSQMADNNIHAGHLDYTLLCLAQTGPCNFPTCGAQWSPNLLAAEDELLALMEAHETALWDFCDRLTTAPAWRDNPDLVELYNLAADAASARYRLAEAQQ